MKLQILENKIKELLPIKQNLVSKRLNINHRVVSDAIRKMMQENQLTRRKVHRTYFLEIMKPKNNKNLVKAEVFDVPPLLPCGRRGYYAKIDPEVLKDYILNNVPIKQEAVWKRLKISHSFVSKVVGQLVTDGLIHRIKEQQDGARCTYILEMKGMKEKRKIRKPYFSSLLAGRLFAPCTGCAVPDCDPAICPRLHSWVLVPY